MVHPGLRIGLEGFVVDGCWRTVLCECDETLGLARAADICFLSVFQWLCSVVALQCSILKHLSAKQMTSLWDSEQTEKADIKPVIVADGSITNPYQAADKAPTPSLYSMSCTSGITTQNSLSSSQSQQTVPQEEINCSSCLDKPKKGSSCGTSNGPTASEVKVNGPHFYGVSSEPSAQLTDSQRLIGPGNTIPVMSSRQTWPRPLTPPAACGLLNHTAGTVVKTENIAGPISCAQRGTLPVTSLPASLPSSCASLETTSTLQRKNVQTQIGPPLAAELRSAGSPLTATRALTPPQATGDGSTHRFCSPAPPSGEHLAGAIWATLSPNCFTDLRLPFKAWRIFNEVT